jgi:hypothetical protein
MPMDGLAQVFQHRLGESGAIADVSVNTGVFFGWDGLTQ